MYTELHCHSAFSYLDGASSPAELAGAAVELGYDAVALTDHNSVSGSMEFAQAAVGVGLRAIHGAELDVVDGPTPAVPGTTRHVTLLVENQRGWSNLCRLLTHAHAHAPPAVSLDVLVEHTDGLVCLSGCARQGVRDEPTMRRLLTAFGRDRFRIELQRPFLRHDRALNRGLSSLAERLGVPCVATGNVHVHARSRAPLQDVFVAIREHTTLDASEPLRRGNWSHVLASPAAMAARFADHPRAVAETRELAQRLTFDLTADLGYRYPGAEDVDASRRLAELCWVRLEERYGGDTLYDDAHARLEEELRVIDALGLAGFFLLHRDLLELAREVAVEVRGASAARALLPPGRGRGSSVSSIVCYLTGLSHIDPVRNELFLGRFLNEELTALPDIDLDFPRDVREVLLPRVHERYGRERSAIVAAFPTFRVRGAIREIGKALGLPPGEIERVARGSEPFSRGAVDTDVEVALGRRVAAEDGSRWKWLARLCHDAYGLPRHLSQHSGGMIVSTQPLLDCVPVLPAAMEGRQLCQWDKDSCADARFLKIDLLGLGMLSAVERCVDLIAQTRNEQIDLTRIPYDDPPTYDAIQRADTMGVFQIESRAQMSSLLRTRPENLDDITIQVAIVRPGPIQGGAVNPYIARRQRLREDPSYVVPYDHPSLEPVLRDTLGTIIFQDQVLEVAIAFAGFSPGEAEGLRRAMSRKRSAAAIEAYHQRFIDGARCTHGADEATAERVYQMIQGFSGFGFPKAHGAAFGLLAYQSTWLRVHYGPEFLCALLNEQPMGFYPSDTLSHEAQRRGIDVLPPDVNASAVECTVDSGGMVRIGLGYLNGVRKDEVTALVRARAEDGPFRSFADLAARAGAGRPALEILAWSGACDCLEDTPTPTAAPAPAVTAAVERLRAKHAASPAAASSAAAVASPAAASSAAAVASPAAASPAAASPAAASPAAAPPPTAPPATAPALRVAPDPPPAPAPSAPADRRRRAALWQLGVATPGEPVADGLQLALPLGLPPAPELRALSTWEAMVADYASTGLTLGTHPMALLRASLPRGTVSSRDLPRLAHEQHVRVGGMVIARQRPGTANGIVFMLVEDEFGTVNFVVSPEVYERYRLLVRGEPLLLAEGRLERHPLGGGQINVCVHRLRSIDAPDDRLAEVHELPAAQPSETAGQERAEPLAAGAGSRAGDFRAVAPPILSFAQGRRR